MNYSYQVVGGQPSLSYEADTRADSVVFHYYNGAIPLRKAYYYPKGGAVRDTLKDPPDTVGVHIEAYWGRWVENYRENVDIVFLDTLGQENMSLLLHYDASDSGSKVIDGNGNVSEWSSIGTRTDTLTQTNSGSRGENFSDYVSFERTVDREYIYNDIPDLDVSDVTVVLAINISNLGSNVSNLFAMSGANNHVYEQNVRLQTNDLRFEYDAVEGPVLSNVSTGELVVLAMRYDSASQTLSTWDGNTKLSDVTAVSSMADPMQALFFATGEFEGSIPNRATGVDMYRFRLYDEALTDSEVSSVIDTMQVDVGIEEPPSTTALSGSIDSSFNLSSNATKQATLSGDITNESTISGNLITQALLSGELQTASDLAGNVVKKMALSGQIDSESSLSASMVKQALLSGSIGTQSALSGNVIIVDEGITSLSGSIETESSLSGNLTATKQIQGIIESETDLSGDLIKQVSLSGNVLTVSSLSADASIQKALSGTVLITSDISGELIPVGAAWGGIIDITNSPLYSISFKVKPMHNISIKDDPLYTINIKVKDE